MVDLQSDENIKQIKYYNRLDCCSDVIKGAKVQLLDQNNNVFNELIINTFGLEIMIDVISGKTYNLNEPTSNTVVTPTAVTPTEIPTIAVTPTFITPTAVTPTAITPTAITPTAINFPKARYVKLLSGKQALQISQFVVLNDKDQNVAKNKPTSASSVYPGTSTDKAVDGYMGARNFPEIYHANTDDDSWWIVDLQNSENIKQIKYYNRKDCCIDRIKGAKIQLLDENKNLVREYEIKISGLEIMIDSISGNSYSLTDSNFTYDPNTTKNFPKARFVRVVSGKKALQISQLVVINNRDENVSVGKFATASSVYPGTSAALAVDGFNGPRKFPDLYHANTDDESWWMVDLQRSEEIKLIKYNNRLDCCTERILGAKVQLLDENKNVVSEYIINGSGHEFIIYATVNTSITTTTTTSTTIISTNETSSLPKARFVRVLSGQKALQISQLVVINDEDLNVAKGKPASASSTLKDTSPATAVDGYMGPRNFPNIYHADTDDQSWWMVDLQKLENIKQIKYYNRLDCCADRILGAKVQLLDHNKNVFKEFIINSFGPEFIINTTINNSITTNVTNNVPKARFVKVISGQKALQISQLVVINDRDNNVSKGKPASASSVYPGTSADTAVDGYLGPRNFPSIYHANTDEESWWMVDLQYVENIKEIKYYNRLDCCQHTIVGARVQLLDENKNVVREFKINSPAHEFTIATY